MKRVLITGAAGSVGTALTRNLLKEGNVVCALDSSEDGLFNLKKNIKTEGLIKNFRGFLGDIRDLSRIKLAMQGCEEVYHCAALKHVELCEYNSFEAIRTNIEGTNNIIQSCMERDIGKALITSSDKAVNPTSFMGATKLVAEKLFIAANNIKGQRELKFSVVRYGNVMGSRGSVIPFFLKEAQKGKLPITNFEMTRFNISLEEGVDMVLWALDNSYGGEIFVPKLPSYSLKSLANAIGPSCIHEVVGIRHGEKLHEEMITSSDSYLTFDIGSYYVILPNDEKVKDYYKETYGVNSAVKEGFSYNSGSNEHFLSVESLRELIKKNVDDSFVPK